MAEKSNKTSCGGYYKTTVYKKSNKTIAIFISNGNCRGERRDFPYKPTGGIAKHCQKYGGTGNYKWVYTKGSTPTTVGVRCEVRLPNNKLSYCGTSSLGVQKKKRTQDSLANPFMGQNTQEEADRYACIMDNKYLPMNVIEERCYK